MYTRILTIILCIVMGSALKAQVKTVGAQVDFNWTLREWDGFGVNYVEVSQTIDYDTDPQEYGGFSLMTESDRQLILDMIFGDGGLKPGVVKMFLDPWHQAEPGGTFDHERTTHWMRYFVREGLNRTWARGDNLKVITTLYGPPAWATKQKILRGRDLDPDQKVNLAHYFVDWVRYLRESEMIPVRYLSLHNEGEAKKRWPKDGSHGNIGKGKDYNMFWPPEQVVDFLKILPPVLNSAGLSDVGVSNGEPTKWVRFGGTTDHPEEGHGYAEAIVADVRALEGYGLIASHGFRNNKPNLTPDQRYAVLRSDGIDLIRSRRPDLHAWTTSMTWGNMDVLFAEDIWWQIYKVKINALIPWACVQRPAKWVGGDPNPGTAIRVSEEGTWEVLQGYYLYKQLCRAGQPGMMVAHTESNDIKVRIIAFACNGQPYPDAMIIVNVDKQPRTVALEVAGTMSTEFDAYRTSDNGEQYHSLGVMNLSNGLLQYEAPARSVTTFFGQQ